MSRAVRANAYWPLMAFASFRGDAVIRSRSARSGVTRPRLLDRIYEYTA